jgi:hypothetical protein
MLDQIRSLGFEPLRIIELNCLVLGETRRHIFPVKTSLAETVGTLRKSIAEEKKHAFQHVDPDDLVLWKVSVPDDESLQENLNKLQVDFIDEKALSPTKDLSEVFSDTPTKHHVHVVIKNSRTVGE